MREWGIFGLFFLLCLAIAAPVSAAGPDEDMSFNTIPEYSCYRTISEISQQLSEWEAAYPDLANVMTVGYSYEGRPLQVIRLTNRLTGNDKPVFFLMANTHGNEIITNEVALVFIQYLLENYDEDPEVTWLLDEHDIYVMISANPDGHIKNEVGEPWADWRKNTNPSYDDCDGDHYGVDLNRNFSFKWGGSGSDSDPCAKYYRGPQAASEYETQAIQTLLQSLFADQRGPEDSDAAPLDATGLLISLHSFGNLVLWPWGYTDVETPNGTQLQQLGQKLAAFTGYRPQQAHYLYPTNGTVDDWAYGELGIAAYTFEIGSRSDGGYYPSCANYDALVQPNIEALLYAAKVAPAPYLTPFGPDTLHVSSTATMALQDRYLEVTATIQTEDDQRIAGAEVYIDLPPWSDGVAYPLKAVDGAFDEVTEIVWGRVSIPNGSAIAGRHRVFVRGRDTAGYWGPVTSDFFTTTSTYLMPSLAIQAGIPGAQVPYTLTLTNIDHITHTFILTQSTSLWPTTVTPTRVIALPPGDYVTVSASVFVPPEEVSLLPSVSDRVTITMTLESDPAVVIASAVLITRSRQEQNIFLPLILLTRSEGMLLIGNMGGSLDAYEGKQLTVNKTLMK